MQIQNFKSPMVFFWNLLWQDLIPNTKADQDCKSWSFRKAFQNKWRSSKRHQEQKTCKFRTLGREIFLPGSTLTRQQTWTMSSRSKSGVPDPYQIFPQIWIWEGLGFGARNFWQYFALAQLHPCLPLYFAPLALFFTFKVATLGVRSLLPLYLHLVHHFTSIFLPHWHMIPPFNISQIWCSKLLTSISKSYKNSYKFPK